MRGHAYGEHPHVERCPYCGHPCEADYVDVGVGMVQCGPFHCDNCLASEIGPNDKPRELSDVEERTGWYAPNSEPGSSANVIGGKIVSANAMRSVYREAFVNNPDYWKPGAVDEWRRKLREKKQ